MKRRDVTFAAVLLAIFIVVASGLVVIRSWANPGFTPARFSKDAWKQADAEKRGYMVENLLATRQLVGMTKNEVSDLLGRPDEDQKALKRYRYHLGRMGRNPNATFLTDFSLLIRFDNNDVVAGVSVAD